MVFICGLGLVLLVWYYLGQPIQFYFKYKIQARPTIEICDPSELPEAVRVDFDHRFAEFAALQFRHCGTFTMSQAIKNFKSLFAVYEHEQSRVIAVTTAMFLKVNKVWLLKRQCVAIGSRFSDGVEIDTTNMNDLFVYPLMPGWIRTQHPELQSTADLFNAHLSFVEHHRRGRVSVSEFKTKYDGDVLRFYSESLFEEFSRSAEFGYLKLKKSQFENAESDQQSQNDNPYSAPAPDPIDQGSVFVPTFIGAFKIVWQVVWPIKPILTRIQFARDRKLLAETGYQWP